jgi:peptide/nickel transport system substrate-binding protein
MDQFREELVGSNIKGKNPLKDLRVRKALYQAIDSATLQRVTMRGMSKPTGAIVSPLVNGWTEAVDKRLPFDANAAKASLAEAGYKDGFEVDFACSNNAIVQDEELCQAITSMWSRIGVKAKLRTLPARPALRCSAGACPPSMRCTPCSHSSAPRPRAATATTTWAATPMNAWTTSWTV